MSLGREGLHFINYGGGEKKLEEYLPAYMGLKAALALLMSSEGLLLLVLFSTLLILTCKSFYTSSEFSSKMSAFPRSQIFPYQYLVGAELLAHFPCEMNLLSLPLTVGFVSHLVYSHLSCLFLILLLSHDFFLPQRRQPCTVSEVFHFCWVLFIYAKGKERAIFI